MSARGVCVGDLLCPTKSTRKVRRTDISQSQLQFGVCQYGCDTPPEAGGRGKIIWGVHLQLVKISHDAYAKQTPEGSFAQRGRSVAPEREPCGTGSRPLSTPRPSSKAHLSFLAMVTVGEATSFSSSLFSGPRALNGPGRLLNRLASDGWSRRAVASSARKTSR